MKNIILFLLLSFFTKDVCCETEMVSVKEGESVTLHIDFEMRNNEILTWSFKELTNPVIVEMDKKTDVTIYDDVLDGRFKDRLKVDKLTGDLTIRNIRSEHAGVYEVTGKYIPDKLFSIHVLPDDGVKTVFVMEGDSVTLNTDVTDIQKYVIRWRFEHQNKTSPIAEINKSARNISKYDVPDERFKHRLQLDYLTGSLTIKNIGLNHSGDYEVDLISSSKHTVHKTFRVTVSGEPRTVFMMEGDSVTLHTDLSDIQRDDLVLWLFGANVIAEIYQIDSLNKYIDESYRDRLSLDEKNGSLTIRNIKIRDSGLYELKINSRTHSVHKRFTVTVTGEMRTVFMMKGDSLTLHTDLAEIYTDDLVQWNFKDSQIAEIHKADNRLSTSDERFRDRLSLDEKNGSLTIMNIRNTDSGQYELKISSSRHSVHKRFTVTVYESGLSSSAVAGIVVALLFAAVAAAVAAMIYRRKSSMLKRYEVIAISANMKDDVTLRSEKQTPDEIRWRFGDQEILLAKFKRETGEFAVYDGPDGRFRDKLRLDDKTGSLTITNITTEHTGVYNLQTNKSNKVSTKIFSVTVSGNPEEVPLNSVNAS